MARTRKMVNLAIEETSGVDHPAHLNEGWLVMKAANPSDIQSVLDETLKKEYTVKPQDKKKADDEMLPEDEMAKEEMPEKDEEETDEEKMARLRSMKKSSTEDFLKSAPEPVIKMIADLRKAADEAVTKAALIEAELQAERNERADSVAIEKAKGWTNLNLDATKVGPALRRLSSVDEELAKSLEEVLTSVNAQAESANIFAEIGKPAGFSEDNAYGRMTSMAKSAVESGVAKSFEQALADVALSNPELYKQYLSEKGA